MGTVSAARGFLHSFRFRLLLAINLVAGLGLAGFLLFEYQRELSVRIASKRESLREDASLVLTAVLELQHHGLDSIQRYIDDACGQIREAVSPGHHIVVDLDGEILQSQSHHRSSSELYESMRRIAYTEELPAARDREGLIVGGQSTGEVAVLIAQGSYPLFAQVRHDAWSRLGAIALVGIAATGVVNLILMQLVTRPMARLVTVVRRIGRGELGLAPDRIGSTEFDFLSTEIGSMSRKLADRERDHANQLAKARRIQENLRPGKREIRGLKVAVIYRPADRVGGDFYDVIELGGGQTLICLADVVGHGIPAAMSAAILKTLLMDAAERLRDPATILQVINRRFWHVTLAEDFASVFLLHVDADSDQVRYANAGHEPGSLICADRTIESLDPTGLLLGIEPDAEWETRRFALRRSHGDRLVLVTDGVTESRDESGEIFGRERLRHLLTNNSETMTDATELCRTIDATVDRYRFDAATADDLTILVIDRCGNGG